MFAFVGKVVLLGALAKGLVVGFEMYVRENHPDIHDQYVREVADAQALKIEKFVERNGYTIEDLFGEDEESA